MAKNFNDILAAIDPADAARYRALPQLQGLTDINAFGPNTGTLNGKRVNYFVMGDQPGEYRVENGIVLSNSTQRDTNYLQPEGVADGQFFITSEGNAPRMEAPAKDENMLSEAWKAYGPILVAAAMGAYQGGAFGEAAAASAAPATEAAAAASTGGTALGSGLNAAGFNAANLGTAAVGAETALGAGLTGTGAGSLAAMGGANGLVPGALGTAAFNSGIQGFSSAAAASLGIGSGTGGGFKLSPTTQAPKSPDGAGKSAIDYAKEYAPLLSAASALGALGMAVTPAVQQARAPDSPSTPPLMAPPTASKSQAAKTPSPNVFKKKMASLGDPTILTGAGGVPNSSLTLGRATVLGS